MLIKWGILGPGHIAQRFATALNQGADGQLVAVASRDEQRASQFASAYQAERYYTSYAALAADEQIDIVYISTPHNFHFEQAMMCLHAGKHLLIEKPICVNAHQAEKIIELARQNNLFVMEALWSRFLPTCQQAKQWLQAGEIGTLQAINSSICFAFNKGDEHRAVNKNLAGGALLDLGVYSVALSQWMMDANPMDIQAMAKIGTTGVDNTLLANLRYPNDRLGQFVTSVEAKSANNMLLHGSKGTIEICDMFWAGHVVKLVTEDKKLTLELPHAVNGFEYQIREVEQCIKAGKQQSATMPLSDTLANMHVMDAIRQQIGLDYGKTLEAV
ncbi:Gfo/Idh/MocA family protein [Neptunicella sp. SCSIO 80796]|uniref:Gfo/Idh/MocA family protein n=1 Tax=Neptunicella plasticusilytica TaxID=3117012 RepID=UPI003A4E1EEC